MTVFKAAYQDWLAKQHAYWTGKTPHIPLRDARDRLIDLLKIGQTYPLRDLAVKSPLMVAFNTPAKIPIANSQADVSYQLYQLCDNDRKAIDKPPPQEGTGDNLLLETPPIQKDSLFKIKATKQQTKQSQFLLKAVEVKVGLDTALKASILAAPLLDPVENPSFDAPRIVDYGASVKVEIQQSQEGVDYRLVYFRGTNSQEIELSLEDKRGDLSTIVLQTQAVVEDIDIRIRATKTFDPSEHLPQQTALLDAVLPLKVRANPRLAMSVEPVIDFKGKATLKIAATQASTQYRLYARRIPDSEFIRGTPAPDTVLTVPVQGKPNVQVKKPAPPSAIWEQDPPGYAAVGGFTPGNDGDLALTIGSLTTDSLVIVQAQKKHQYSKTITSAVQLQQAVVVLTRPDPARQQLQLKAQQKNGVIQGPIQILGGQPGVFYHFSTAEGAVLGPPVYFHQTDDADPSQNKGVGQLALEVDFVVTPARSQLSPDPAAKTRPEPPILDIGTSNLQTSTQLSIRAVKAQTGLEVTFKPGTVGDLLARPDPT